MRYGGVVAMKALNLQEVLNEWRFRCKSNLDGFG
jgi:hypothetical protein